MLDKSKRGLSLVKNGTLKPKEIAKFDVLAKEWWDTRGKMKSAIKFNQSRLAYVKQQILNHYEIDHLSDRPLSGLTILDVGCGGGLLSEPLAQAGASVTGIDASAVSIEVAIRHAISTKTVGISYEHKLSKDLVNEGKTYDVVINAEVVEHVQDQKLLIDECCKLVKPGGMLILATLNKTIKSYVIAIIGAEYVLRYLPIGTHDWRYFVKPERLQRWTQARGFSYLSGTGMAFNPLAGKWRYTHNMAVNYCLCFTK